MKDWWFGMGTSNHQFFACTELWPWCGLNNWTNIFFIFSQRPQLQATHFGQTLRIYACLSWMKIASKLTWWMFIFFRHLYPNSNTYTHLYVCSCICECDACKSKRKWIQLGMCQKICSTNCKTIGVPPHINNKTASQNNSRNEPPKNEIMNSSLIAGGSGIGHNWLCRPFWSILHLHHICLILCIYNHVSCAYTQFIVEQTHA